MNPGGTQSHGSQTASAVRGRPRDGECAARGRPGPVDVTAFLLALGIWQSPSAGEGVNRCAAGTQPAKSASTVRTISPDGGAIDRDHGRHPVAHRAHDRAPIRSRRDRVFEVRHDPHGAA